MFKNHVRKAASVLGIALMLAIFLPKLALADDEGDPPSVVARLSLAEGPVSFEPGGTDDWVDAVINRPVTTGDKLWADDGGRAELQLDASTIRLSRNTGFSFLNLDDNITQIRLTEGTILVRVRFLENDETYEVDTPNLAFSITRPGIYRINVNEGGDSTRIIVRNGEGQVTGGGASYSVRTNDDAVFSGGDQLNADVQDYANDDDDFDAWSAQRDRRSEHSRSSQYVSADVVGYQDLDDHGDWADAPEYGHVWYPRVEVGWAPYQRGHWAYIAPWGYTWVDDQPWGFAPFHYGRWANVEGRWGWIPSAPRVVGVAYVRPVYAPALVAFVGGGVAVGVVGGGASVGWFALGPREVYVPSYHTSPRYVERVNISNTTVNRTVVNNYYNTTVVNKTTVNNVTYVNQRVPGAVVATSQQAFTSAQPVSRNVVRMDQRQLAAAQVSYRAPAVVPTRQAVLGSGQAAAHQPPAAVAARPVVAKAAPPPPPPSFEARAQAIKANGGQPISMQQARQIQPAPAARAQVAAVRVAPPPSQPVVSVRQAPKPAQPVNRAPAAAQGNVAGRPGQPGVQPQAAPANRPANAPANAPGAVQPGRPATPPPNATQPNAAQPNNRPVTQPNPGQSPANRPITQPNPAQPVPANRPSDRPADRPGTPPNAVQQNNRPPAAAQPTPAPAPNRPVTPPNTVQHAPANRPVTQPNPAQPNSGNRPADRPADRPVTPPNAAQPNNRPADRPPAAQPNNRPAEPPAARPAPAPAPAPRPADRPVERPVPQPAPAPRPADRPVERPAPRPNPDQQRQQEKQQQQQQKEKPKDKDKEKDKDKPKK